MRIPISTKLISVTIGIVVAATGPIVYMSSDKLAKDASEMTDFTNMVTATNKATEVDGIVTNFVDKLQTLGNQMLRIELNSGLDMKDLKADVNSNFEKTKHLVNLEVLQISSGSFRPITKKTNREELQKWNLDANYPSYIHSWQKFPMDRVVEKSEGQIVIRSGTFSKGPALLTVAFPLAKDSGRISHIAVADILLAPFLKPFSDPNQLIYLLDENGDVLAFQDDKILAQRPSLKQHPFIEDFLQKTNNNKQKLFTDPKTKENFFGAAVKSQYNLIIFSQMSQSIVTEKANALRNEAILISGVALSVAILVIFLVSLSLTAPIVRLSELIKLVKTGNFDLNAKAKVRSHDEVGDLATAFDEMTEGLKERDKVKNLFSKFHGSSVAEELLQKEISLGGQRKDVVIFFSDIRGFTSFSEARAPEEVVEMLNEYFTEMVRIISKHNGVVDKFIGDAIMAVWGAPKSSGQDCIDAVRACIEMRQSLAALNEKRISRGQDPIQIGMGLNTGPAISGNIGSEERVEYTVIGNTVNTASRIEASTKAFGSDLLISDDVREKLGDTFLTELAGSAEVKGRSEPLKLFKVKGYVDESGRPVEVATPYSDYTPEKADKVKVAS